MPVKPSVIPEKFGLISIRLASGPVETAPCIAVAATSSEIAAVELQPE